MTDLPNSEADGAPNDSTADGESPAGDPELASLVQRDATPDDGDPSLAALVTGVASPDAAAEAAEPAFDVSSVAAESTSTAESTSPEDTTSPDASPSDTSPT